MLEAKITTNIKRWLERNHFVVLKVYGGPMQAAGWPDLLAWRDGVSYAFEVKRPGGKTTKLQLNRLHRLRDQSVVCGVVESVQDVKDLLHGGDA